MPPTTTFFNFRLEAKSKPGPGFVQIGSDLGFLPRLVTMESFLSNAERADVIVDFSAFDGQDIVMTNDAANPFPIGFHDTSNADHAVPGAPAEQWPRIKAGFPPCCRRAVPT